MLTQVLRDQSVEVQAFAALLRGHMSATKQLNGQLVADHGLTLSDYSVLLQLAWAPDRRMRRVDLADRILLTASGVTRLLDGLEDQGFVGRAACDSDRRVVYAVLTDRGLEKLREAAVTHVAQIETLFGARFEEGELDTLVGLLARLVADEADEVEANCSPPDDA
jgi:DNA-binding MarR family transcriptional regulator